MAWDTGVLRCRTTGWDPFFTRTGLAMTAVPYHYIVLRIKADKPGMGELFWTGVTTGPFGGFRQDKAVKWDPLRLFAPIRKPLLGYYDESNPEVVDWQIKWAVENGITGFLVDWYWEAGNLTSDSDLHRYNQAQQY